MNPLKGNHNCFFSCKKLTNCKRNCFFLGEKLFRPVPFLFTIPPQHPYLVRVNRYIWLILYKHSLQQLQIQM